MKLQFYILLASLIGWGFASADVIVINNGDRLTGAIVKAEGGRIVIATPYAGNISVAQDQIVSITSDKEFAFEFLEKPEVIGKFAIDKNGKLTIKQKDGKDFQAVELKQLVAMRDAAIPKPKPVPVKKWHNNASIGFSTSSADLDIMDVNGSFGTRRIWGNKILDIFARAHYNENTNPNNNITTIAIDQAATGAKLYIQSTVRRYFYLSEEIDRDRAQRIDWRNNTGGGLGYKLIKRDRIDLAGEAGLAYIFEEHLPIGSGYESKPSARFAEILAIKLGVNTNIQQTAEIYPRLDSPGDYIFNARISLNTSLTKHIGWGISAEEHYDSRPFNKTYTNNYSVSTNLIFNW